MFFKSKMNEDFNDVNDNKVFHTSPNELSDNSQNALSATGSLSEGDSRDVFADVQFNIKLSCNSQIGRAAMLLALMPKDQETILKASLQTLGWFCVATEVGGICGELPPKISKALVGAALNGGVIRKTPSEMHALMHAAKEALNSFMPYSMLESSIGAKIAIVRSDSWLAVAIAGDAAYHAIAHHERFGYGVMHL